MCVCIKFAPNLLLHWIRAKKRPSPVSNTLDKLMKKIIHIIFLVSLIFFPLACTRTNYTGIWKGNCSDYYGIQIKPAENQLYSVSFCGLDGCFEPGEWTPNTRIEGDPKYNIFSPGKIGIKRMDGGDFFTYMKCTSDPTWISPEPKKTETTKLPECSFTTANKEEGVLIAWVTNIRKTSQFGPESESKTTVVGPFRPIVLLNGHDLMETPGSTIRKEQPFWYVLSPTSKPVKLSSVGSFLDHMNEDHCVYFGTIEEPNPTRWTLLSSKPIPHVFRSPTHKDRAEFYRLNTTCVQQGDYPEDQKPPCVQPQLLAITDINKNGKLEYWATEPYFWDTGLTVWEKNNGVLTPMLQVCVGCSD